MARTRGGGTAGKKKPCVRDDEAPVKMTRSKPCVREDDAPVRMTRSKRIREEESGGENVVLRRSPRRFKTTAGGVKEDKRMKASTPKRLRFGVTAKEPTPKKAKRANNPMKKKTKDKEIEEIEEIEGPVVNEEGDCRYGPAEEDYPSEGDDATDADNEAEVRNGLAKYMNDVADDRTDVAEDRDVVSEDRNHEGEEDFLVEEANSREMTLFFGDAFMGDNTEMEDDSGDEVCDDDNIPEPPSSDEENEENGWLGEAYREDVDPDELLKLGKFFADADDFKHACLRYTLKSRYNIKFYRSGTYKIGVKCAAKPKKDMPPCPWKIYCSFEKSKMKLQIKTFFGVHTCDRTGDSKILKRSAIASLFAERLRLNPKITAKEIVAEIRREYKMNVSENSCSKAKTKLMNERKRTHEQHFDRIWDYQAEVLGKNRGSTFEIEMIPRPTIGRKQRFYRLYMCYEAQKVAWKRTCRPIFGLDGTFLKWDIKGQLLAAVGRDGDNKIVPIAWAVVKIENDTNWDWFIKKLAKDLDLKDGKEYTILSDKQKGLVKAIKNVLPQAEHRQCCRHIYENWRKGGVDLKLQMVIQGLQFHESQGSQQQSYTEPSPWEVPQASQGQSSQAASQQWDHGYQNESMQWEERSQYLNNPTGGWSNWFS